MAANYAFGSIGYDTTFELNEFNEPRIRSEAETLKDVVLFVLFSRPGQYPSIPWIGLNIEEMLYSFYDEIDEDELKRKLTEQCGMLGAYLNSGAVAIKKTKYKGEPSLMIHIEGTERFPAGYKSDRVGTSDRFLIGITFDEMKKMIYNVTGQRN